MSHEWLDLPKIPLGQAARQAVESLNDALADEFRWGSDGVSAGVGAVIDGLAAVPAPVFIGLATLGVYLARRRLWLAVLTAAGLGLIANLGYWQEMLETLALVSIATLAACALGIPLGILAARRAWFGRILSPVLDLMQTIPTFVYLIPTLMLFGLGMAPGLVSTVIFALPAPVRLTQLGMKGVPHQLCEVGDSFGATRWQRLWKIELPYAWPSIRAGISQCVMLALSMVVIAALVGANGLGKPVVQALNTVNVAKGFEAGIAIVVVAVLMDRIIGTARRAPAR